MGKVSPVSIKYTIFAKFEATGVVEKPDVIGAIFGQTEGLLGEDLELRDLQKNGKIGRIEVSLKTESSKTEGEIQIPTSLDKSETSIIAAAIETIERVGPCDAKVKIERIDDVRSSKRDYVLERAKALLAGMSSPDSREMQSAVTASARTSKVQEYGEEQLPSGPDMDNEEIIVVEGRADVLNLLTYGIKNSIAMNGASLPKTITKLGETKKLILFVDGDRGGILNAKDAIANANIHSVAQAPAGKEVEELTGKEIISCLRAAMPVKDFQRMNFSEERGGESRKYSPRRGRMSEEREPRSYSQEESALPEEKREKEISNDEEISIFREKLNQIQGTRAILLLDINLNEIRKISASSLMIALKRIRRQIYAIVYDGLATNTMIDLAESAGCKHFVAKNFAVSRETKINLLSL